MKKRFAALLLMLMLVLQILIPAYAREEMPIPFSITALQADEEKVLVLDGLYLDGRFYAMASDMSELLRGTQAYKEGRSFSFTAHGKSRRFRAEMDKKRCWNATPSQKESGRSIRLCRCCLPTGYAMCRWGSRPISALISVMESAEIMLDSDNDYARTCFTLRDGCIQVLARYLGDQQL